VQKKTLGKEFAECFFSGTRQSAYLPSARKKHSANYLTLGKEPGSGSDMQKSSQLVRWIIVINSLHIYIYIYIPSYSTSNPSNICLIPCMHRCMEAITLLPSEVKCLLLQLTQILWDIGGKQIQTIQIATAPRGLVEKNINELVEKTIMNGLSQNNVDWWKQKKTRGSIRW